MKKYRVFSGIWMTIALLWSIGAESFWPMLIFGAILAWALFMAHAGDARQESLNAELLALVGAKAGDAGVYSYGRADTGIAVNAAAEKIAVGKKKLRKAHAFDDVREWSSAKETAGQTIAVGGGVAFGTMAALQSGAAAGAAAARSGFFVTVRDIDNPKWRIEMPATDDQARWMEILRQAINRD